MVLILTQEDMQRLLSMKEALDVIERAFIELERGTAKVPLRSIIEVKKYKGTVLFMPAFLSDVGALSTKIVSVYEENPKYGLPTVLASILLTDPRTGQILCVMDGAYATAIRTGAASGVATKYLSRRDSKTVGIIGTGTQAKTQLWAVCQVRNVQFVKAYDIRPEAAKNLAKEMSKKLGIKIKVVDDSKKAVEDSDIVVTATTSKSPVLNGQWIRPGTHINAIGWMGPTARELDAETVKKAKLVVDSREAALAEAGDLIIPIKEGAISERHIYAELGEILTQKISARTSNEEITLWKSVGLAIQDAAIAKHAYERALRRGIGTKVEL